MQCKLRTVFKHASIQASGPFNMLSGSQGDSNIGDKVPLRESITGSTFHARMLLIRRRKFGHGDAIGAPFKSIMSAANASHPFSIPFSVFLPDCLCLCMSGWLPEAKIRGCLSPIPGGDSGEVRGSRLSTLVSQHPSPLFSYYLLIFPFARSYAPTSPMLRASCILEGGRHLLIPILETLPPRYRSIIVHPSSSFSLLESLSPFFVCLYITGLISILL